MCHPRPLFRLFSAFFKQAPIQFYNKPMWRNVHPVYGTGIRTHNLLITSLLPQPLDQGSRMLHLWWWWSCNWPYNLTIRVWIPPKTAAFFLYKITCKEQQLMTKRLLKLVQAFFVNLALLNGLSPPLFRLFRSFSNKHQYNFHNKLMWKQPPSMQCWDSNPRPSEHETLPITTRSVFNLIKALR